jgi:hypothetical protein
MALEGNLSYTELADLLKIVNLSSKTGTLYIAGSNSKARLYFETGKLLRAESSRFSTRVGDILVDQGVMTRERVDVALDIQSKENGARKLGAIICDDLNVEVKDIEAALRTQFKSVVVDLLTWPEGQIYFDVSAESNIKERFVIDAAGFILDIGIEAGYLAEMGNSQEL